MLTLQGQDPEKCNASRDNFKVDDATVLFVDMVGSTALYQALGNARAAGLVSGMTEWISRLCQSAGGSVIRLLGDGVLVAFRPGAAALECAIELQRRRTERNAEVSANMRVQLRIGMARGPLVKAGADWVGEVIKLATDLSHRCGPEQILASGVSVDRIMLGIFVRFRNLGLMHVRGKSEPVDVFQIEWENDTGTDMPTVRGNLGLPGLMNSLPVSGIRLSWVGRESNFAHAELPIVLGRHELAHFMLPDPYVSRLHARIYARDQVVVLENTSRNGTSVRFRSSTTVLTLRGQECVLHDDCEIALAASFASDSVPLLRLQFFG